MDSVTQAVLGASIQGTSLGKYQGRKAYLYGAALATVPDLDVFIRYANPITAMTTHRGFSHSIFVLTTFAALLSWLIDKYRPAAQRGYSQQRLFITLWLVLVTHPILDSFTVYGTQLFWPLERTPESWSSVFIIDPIFTLPLLLATLLGLLFGYRRRVNQLAWFALCFTCAYLAFSLVAKQISENRARATFAAHDITLTRLKSIPMPLTTLLWRVLAEDDQNRRYELVSGLLDDHPPQWREMAYHRALNAKMADNPNYQRLSWFSDGWVDVRHEHGAWILIDERMGYGGQSFFRFTIAQDDANAEPQPVFPEAAPRAFSSSDRSAQLGHLWQRLRYGTALPYAQWSE
ncbi:metal-dependent hydrolase [Suttonella sp. R2A3]|uniref:metal-dependent hydrolase n=1 Tax=Suttonella sp. R2A3 TaxID=2908648 RepID=UPI001F2945AC|nr:metal-dependent hydrolase [Suttonella sp. R2A3]UJF23850.1 metal-dependent hydrolase [Suttonella sp. R2A3]